MDAHVCDGILFSFKLLPTRSAREYLASKMTRLHVSFQVSLCREESQAVMTFERLDVAASGRRMRHDGH